MSTMQTPQDEIAAMQATLARHEEDLQRLKQWLPESGAATGSLLASIVAELTATRDGIRRELSAVHKRLDDVVAAQANANREIAGLRDDVAGIKVDVAGIKDDVSGLKVNVAGLNDDVAGIKDDVSGLKVNVAGLNDDVAGIKVDVAGLKDDVAGLKVNVAVLNDDVASIKVEIASIKKTLDMLVARTNNLVSQYDTMSKSLTVIESRVGNLTGSRYERRVARNIRGILRRSVGLSQAQVLHRDWGETNDDLIDLLDDADDRGAITRQEREDVLDADIITAGVGPDGERAYAVIEIGVTTESVDVNRAARRARTIAKATGAECSAVVVGNEIPAAERERATRAGVAIVTVADTSD